MIAIWPAGPPNEMKPSFSQKRAASLKVGRLTGAAWFTRASIPQAGDEIALDLEHFRRAGLLGLGLVARGDEVAGDHFVVRLPGAHHRVDAGIRVDDDFEERRSLELDELLDDARHVLLAVEPHRVAEAVGL